ncbi:MAG: PilZ domain-containing protein [Terracidiphilus sp.]
MNGDAAVDRSRETGVYHPFDDNSSGAGDCGEAKNSCAYNKTRGYILGVEIAGGDFSASILADRLPGLTPKSGAGLWMTPFRGIPATDLPVPLDLIYLDRNHRVIETVEFFPTFRVSPSSPLASSVLALPVHSIFSSHTQPGDQIAFGRVEDVEHELAVLFGSGAAANATQEAMPARLEPVPGNEPASPREASYAAVLPREVEHPRQQTPPPPPVEETAQPEPSKYETPKKKKSWLQKLISPDPVEPRKNVRESVPGLTAYFFTGGNSVPQTVRDISSTGLFVVTEERWYPGTLVQMTLKKTDEGTPRTEHSISLTVKSLRWGNDGVGVAFILRDPRNPTYDSIHAQGATRAEMDQFLARIGVGQA